MANISLVPCKVENLVIVASTDCKLRAKSLAKLISISPSEHDLSKKIPNKQRKLANYESTTTFALLWKGMLLSYHG